MKMRRCDDDRVTALAIAAGRGDPAALEDFIKATQDDVWRFIRFLGYAAHADDLTQETYLRALHSLPGFAGRSTARTWLLTIARRAIVDHVRRESVRPQLSLHADHQDVGSNVVAFSERHDTAIELTILINALDESRREAFVLTQILGLSYREAAAICSCPVGTIRSRVARARSDLQAAYHADRSTTG